MLLAQSAWGATQCEEQDCGDIHMGRPKLWSLSDAQYLVGQALQKMRDMRVKLPEDGEIDPNKVHSRELEIITRTLGIDVGFDQAIGAKNQAIGDNYAYELQRAEVARAELPGVEQELEAATTKKAAADAEVVRVEARRPEITTRIDDLAGLIAALKEVGADPPDPRIAQYQQERVDLMSERAGLNGEIAAAKAEATVAQAEVARLEAKRTALLAETTPAAPAFESEDAKVADAQETALATLLEKNPGLEKALSSRLEKILDDDATLHYVHELDNLVDAQLQVISRRLSLLRQSVDPNYDLYFLETTASLTPLKQAKHHYARARWDVVASEVDYGAILELYDYRDVALQDRTWLDATEAIEETNRSMELARKCRDPNTEVSAEDCLVVIRRPAQSWRARADQYDELAEEIESALARKARVVSEIAMEIGCIDGILEILKDEESADKLREKKELERSIETLRGKPKEIDAEVERAVSESPLSGASIDATEMRLRAELDRARALAAQKIEEAEGYERLASRLAVEEGGREFASKLLEQEDSEQLKQFKLSFVGSLSSPSAREMALRRRREAAEAVRNATLALRRKQLTQAEAAVAEQEAGGADSNTLVPLLERVSEIEDLIETLQRDAIRAELAEGYRTLHERSARAHAELGCKALLDYRAPFKALQAPAQKRLGTIRETCIEFFERSATATTDDQDPTQGVDWLQRFKERGDYLTILALGAVAAAGDDPEFVLVDQKPYLFEMTPQQSEMNISRNQALRKRFTFSGAFTLLFGFGAGTRYDRQRDRFGQFLEQRVFIAGHGKGNSKFGWDYAPLPGEKWVAPGAYTTYGVLAVPKYRRALNFRVCESWMAKPKKISLGVVQKLPSEGCWDADTVKTFGEWDDAPDSRSEEADRTFKELVVYLPKSSDFWVSSMYYDTVPEGEDITVILRGKGFTRETTVLVNNTPLEPRWRLIDPDTNDVSYLPAEDRLQGKDKLPSSINSRIGGSRTTKGVYEVVSSDSIVLHFNTGSQSGVPQITVVSPHKSTHLNRLKMTINGRRSVSLKDIAANFEAGRDAEHIFFMPKAGWPGVSGWRYLSVDSAKREFSALLTLAGADLTAGKTGSRIEVALSSGDKPLKALAPGEFQLMPKQRRIFISNQAAEGDAVTVRIARCQGGPTKVLCGEVGGGIIESMFFHTEGVPYVPSVQKIEAASGLSKGGYAVKVSGKNLSAVSRVLFGAAAGRITAHHGSNAITVNVPKGKNGEKVLVRAISRFKRDGQDVASKDDVKFEYKDLKSASAITRLLLPGSLEKGKPATVVAEVSGFDLSDEKSIRISTGRSEETLAAAEKIEVLSTKQISTSFVVTDSNLMVKVEQFKDGKLVASAKGERKVPAKPENLELDKKEGQQAGGETVTIIGDPLWNVTKVKFGAKVVDPDANEDNRVVVSAPEGDSKGKVFVWVKVGDRAPVKAGEYEYK